MVKAGLDYSWKEASFAVADPSGRILLDEFLEFPPRNASGLPGWIEQLLGRHGLTLRDISEWSVGTGPGSFTGLRVAASFVLGLTFGKPVRRRGVSTASAIAGSLNLESSVRRVMVLFDGRREELLAFGLERDGDSFKPSGFHAVLDRNSLAPLREYDAFASLEKDAEKVREIAGPGTVRFLHTVPHVSAARLITYSQEDFTMPLTAPVYLRPAVFVEPRPPRQL